MRRYTAPSETDYRSLWKLTVMARKPASKPRDATKGKKSTSDYLTVQLEQLAAIFQILPPSSRRELMGFAEALVAKEEEKKAERERQLAEDAWLREFDAKMKAAGCEYEFVDDFEDGLTPEQRWDMVAEILATIALRVVRKEQEEKRAMDGDAGPNPHERSPS